MSYTKNLSCTFSRTAFRESCIELTTSPRTCTPRVALRTSTGLTFAQIWTLHAQLTGWYQHASESFSHSCIKFEFIVKRFIKIKPPNKRK